MSRSDFCPCDAETTIDPWCAAAGMCVREPACYAARDRDWNLLCEAHKRCDELIAWLYAAKPERMNPKHLAAIADAMHDACGDAFPGACRELWIDRHDDLNFHWNDLPTHAPAGLDAAIDSVAAAAAELKQTTERV